MTTEYKLIDDRVKHLSGSVVEIGSERGEGSTQYLATVCKKYGLKFYTTDIEKGAYKRAKNICANAYHMAGTDFLDNVFPKDTEKICFAYLDNFDYIFDNIAGKELVNNQIALYKTMGYEMNNHNSKMHHLAQVERIEEMTADKCFILFDDTWQLKHPKTSDSCWDGKGAFAVSFLLSQGFKVERMTKGEVPHKSYVLLRRFT